MFWLVDMVRSAFNVIASCVLANLGEKPTTTCSLHDAARPSPHRIKQVILPPAVREGHGRGRAQTHCWWEEHVPFTRQFNTMAHRIDTLSNRPTHSTAQTKPNTATKHSSHPHVHIHIHVHGTHHSSGTIPQRRQSTWACEQASLHHHHHHHQPKPCPRFLAGARNLRHSADQV